MDSIFAIDSYINENVAILTTPALSKIAFILSMIGGTWGMSIMSLILLVLFLISKNKDGIYFLVCGLGFGYLLGLLLKNLIARPRPEFNLFFASGWSFPSLHALAATLFFGLIIYLYGEKIKNLFWRFTFTLTLSLLALSIGLSRIVLGVHWASDVLGGIILGLIWLWITARLKDVVFRAFKPKPV